MLCWVNPNVKKKEKERDTGREKTEIRNLERLSLSHLLRYFAGIPYYKKKKRERDKGREEMEIGKYEGLALSQN